MFNSVGTGADSQNFHRNCIGRYNLLQARQGIGCSLILYLICPATSLHKMRQGRRFLHLSQYGASMFCLKKSLWPSPAFPLLNAPWVHAGKDLWRKPSTGRRKICTVAWLLQQRQKAEHQRQSKILCLKSEVMLSHLFWQDPPAEVRAIMFLWGTWMPKL